MGHSERHQPIESQRLNGEEERRALAVDAEKMRRIRADQKASRAQKLQRRLTAPPDPSHSTRLRQLLITHRDEIAAIAARHEATDIALFGSVARGEADQDSDIDLSVNLPGSFFDQAIAMTDLADALTDLLGARVDVLPRDMPGTYPSGGDEMVRRIQLDEIPLTDLATHGVYS